LSGGLSLFFSDFGPISEYVPLVAGAEHFFFFTLRRTGGLSDWPDHEIPLKVGVPIILIRNQFSAPTGWLEGTVWLSLSARRAPV
jgi:hypothetical protein